MELIHVYVDGSVRPTNPGHTGAGVVIIRESCYSSAQTQEEVYNSSLVLSAKNFGKGTNNTAELNAIRLGARIVRRMIEHSMLDAVHVKFFSDSMYAINTSMGNWRARSNQNLIKQTQHELSYLAAECLHIKGHEGHFGNEVSHSLANTAAKEGWMEGKPWFGGVHEKWANNLYGNHESSG